MLHKLLELISEGDLQSITGLASKLGVSEVLLGQMVADLVRGGYLQPLADGCEAHCGGCALQGACAVVGRAHVWGLTEKGRKAMQQERQG